MIYDNDAVRFKKPNLIFPAMRFWFCVTTQANWNIILDKGIWGVSGQYKNVIGKVSLGDRIVFYVVPKRICGIFEVVSEPFLSQESLFKTKNSAAKELFPYRIQIKNFLMPKQPINFETLVNKLDFITNKEQWSFHLKRSMRSISALDYELIYEKCKKQD